MSIKFKEGSTVVIDLEFLSDAEVAFTPASARYRVDSLTSKEAVVEWAAISAPTTTATIVISAANNLIRHTESLEERQIVVEVTDSNGWVAVSTADYDIENLQGVN